MPNNDENVAAVEASSNRQDLNIPCFKSDTDPDETAIRWEKWLKNFARKLRFFRVTSTQDKVDALYIYAGDEVESLIDTIPDARDQDIVVPAYIKDAAEPINDFHRQVYKAHKHFMTMVNKDSARSKFDCMTQGELTMAQYFITP